MSLSDTAPVYAPSTGSPSSPDQLPFRASASSSTESSNNTSIASSGQIKTHKSLQPPPSELSDDEDLRDGYIVSWKTDDTKNEYGFIVELSDNADSDLPVEFTSYPRHKVDLLSQGKSLLCNLNQAANPNREEFRERLEAIRMHDALTFVHVLFADVVARPDGRLEARYFEMRPPTAYQLKLQRDASILRQGTLVGWKKTGGFIKPDADDKHLFDHKDIFFSHFAIVPRLTEEERLMLSSHVHERLIRVEYGAFKSEEGDQVAVHVKILPLELPVPKSKSLQAASSAPTRIPASEKKRTAATSPFSLPYEEQE